MSEMAPEASWRNPRDPTFKDPCDTCTHPWHGLPCQGLANYRGSGATCNCPGPYTDKEAS